MSVASLALSFYLFINESVLITLIMKLSSTDEPQMESGEDRNPGEILDIQFQKNPNQKHKYLEAEPKILGVRVLLT